MANMAIITAKTKDNIKKYYTENSLIVLLPTSSSKNYTEKMDLLALYMYSVIIYYFAQFVALCMLIFVIYDDQTIGEFRSLVKISLLVGLLLLIPASGLVAGVVKNKGLYAALFIVLLTVGLIGLKIPQQILLTTIGYRQPFHFKLFVTGKNCKQKTILCSKRDDYQVTVNGLDYFSCKEGKKSHLYYGVYKQEYPTKLIAPKVKSVYIGAQCSYVIADATQDKKEKASSLLECKEISSVKPFGKS
jgi:hypothetical protein